MPFHILSIPNGIPAADTSCRRRQYNLLFTEAAHILNHVGYYLLQRGEYEQVESLHQSALAICEQLLGPEDPETAVSLEYLAYFYNDQLKYEQAETLYERALTITERCLALII
jgi:tetratricopeptide (TPR) repeat protein